MALFDAADNNVARWRLTTGALLTDTGGDGNALTLTNNGTVANTTGFLGGTNTAASFNGTTQFLTRADSALLDFTTAFTFSAWVKVSAVGSTQTVLSKTDSTNGKINYWAYIDVAGKFVFRASVDGTTLVTITSTTTLSAATWYHVCGTYDNSNLRIYVNGVSDATPVALTGSLYNSPSLFSIGRDRWNDFYLSGSIDDVSLWSRVLSSTEVSSLYTSYVEDFVFVILGTVAYTEEGDTTAIAMVHDYTGTIIYTEEGDTTAIYANQVIPVDGTIVYTEAGDTTAISGGATVGTITYTEAGDTTEVLGTVEYVYEVFCARLRHKTTNALLTGLTTVYLKIYNPLLNKTWDFSNNTWQTAPTTSTATLAAVDATNQPGVYAYTVNTTGWANWISSEIYYDDGTFVYSFQAEDYYADGARANGALSVSNLSVLNGVRTDTTSLLANLALVPTATENAASALAANAARLVDGAVTGAVLDKTLLAFAAGKRRGLVATGIPTLEEYLRQDGINAQISLSPTDAAGNGTPTINQT